MMPSAAMFARCTDSSANTSPEGAVNLPVNDVFAMRVAGSFTGSDGWQKNPYAGEDPPHPERQGRPCHAYDSSPMKPSTPH